MREDHKGLNNTSKTWYLILVPQSLSRLIVHLIFSTKNRCRWLSDACLRQDLHAYLAATVNGLDCHALEVGGVSDHVHMACLLARTMPVATLVAKVKVSSNQMLKPKLGGSFAWQNGYGAFSVSESALEPVCEYIRRQEEHHRTVSFQEEYRAFLARHRVAFDERYVWD